ncbi:MAG: hypothetical protein K6B46_00430 [Opitutales bacterium]|nr:hypothetical protein [Opitutales bacterium]
MTKKIDRQEKLTSLLPPWQLEVFRAFVDLAKAAGLAPVVGEVAAYLYFTREPLSRRMLEQDLFLSHGSACNAIEVLRSFGVLTVHKKSSRSAEHYTIDRSLHDLALAAIHTLFLPAVSTASSSLSRAILAKPDPASAAKIESICRALDFVRQQLNFLEPKK